MTKKLLTLFGFYFFLIALAPAQSQKINNEPMIWGDLQADYYLQNQSFFFLRTQLRHNTNYPGLIESVNLYQAYFQAGYNQKLTDHWRGGVSARYTLDRFNNNQIYQVMLQHNGKIGEVDFIKKAAYDLMNFQEGESMGRFRPMVALERNFDFFLGSRVVRPHLSYELFFYNQFKETSEDRETRLVDRTRLRAALSFQVTDAFWITPFFIKQTEYFNVLSTFVPQRDDAGNEVLDDEGNVILIEKKGGKRNRVEPVLGLSLRWLLPGNNISERTIPNLGELTL